MRRTYIVIIAAVGLLIGTIGLTSLGNGDQQGTQGKRPEPVTGYEGKPAP